MDIKLDAVEVRALGSLIEKEMATPEYYPLSLNALVNACNQKTNRDPVVSYQEKEVARALESLREKQLVYVSSGSRVPKYGQNLIKTRNLVAKESAALCVLMLRGAQTSGEIRQRTERMSRFETVAEVEETLAELMEAGYATRLPRQPGRKEHRYAHLLSGAPAAAEEECVTQVEPAVLEVRAENERIKALEEQVAELRRELEELKSAFAEFKAQFE